MWLATRITQNFHLSQYPLVIQRSNIAAKRRKSLLKMEGEATQRSSSNSSIENFSTSTLAYDRHFICSAPGLLALAEIAFGLVVWTLIAGTEYFYVSAFGWVIFVAIFYWVLTVIFYIIYLTVVYKKIPQVSWKTVGLCFHGSATVMYGVAAAVDAASISKNVRGHYNFNCWVASTFFAILVTLSYAGSTYFSFTSWRLRNEEE
ncbi:hypothetical protein UPYG_G00155070 [Umbra pygmaea]|uniref:MARVEL domain-containing protein n=1 Tax=Umbra pygmaea TaxID=75934 RepID=A0ABD0XMT8_UMBPY